jgi:transglutaminase-like putative cysteine protease
VRIQIGYDIGYEFEQPTPMIVMLNVHYSRVSDLLSPDTMVTEPATPYTSYRDTYGNWCNRVLAPAGPFRLRADAVMTDSGKLDEVDPTAWQSAVEDLPQETLLYLLPSRYCESDVLADTAWDLFGSTAPGWARVQAVSEWVHRHIEFGYQWARPDKTAAMALAEGRGVCRDYAHLGVAFCRGLNIPARYCSGYLSDIGVPPPEDPTDFSGWFEVFLGGRWLTVDPRNLHPRRGRIPIAYGRDAADVAITTTFGTNVLRHFAVVTEEVTG